MTNYRVESSSGRAARKMRLALMGPAFIAAIGYIDPGNFATNIQAGASFGYDTVFWGVGVDVGGVKRSKRRRSSQMASLCCARRGASSS